MILRREIKMDFKQMQYFLCLAQERNMTRAARRLNIVQPALSMRIARLEASLCKQLFFRTPEGVVLTPAGEEFERLVAPIIRDIDRAREEMARLDGKIAGRVKRRHDQFCGANHPADLDAPDCGSLSRYRALGVRGL